MGIFFFSSKCLYPMYFFGLSRILVLGWNFGIFRSSAKNNWDVGRPISFSSFGVAVAFVWRRNWSNHFNKTNESRRHWSKLTTVPAVLVEGESARGSSDRLLKLETDPVQRKEENKKEKRNKKKTNKKGNWPLVLRTVQSVDEFWFFFLFFFFLFFFYFFGFGFLRKTHRTGFIFLKIILEVFFSFGGLPGFYWVSMRSRNRVWLVFGSHRVLIGFSSGFYRVVPRWHWISKVITGFYRFFFNWFICTLWKRIASGFVGFYWVLPGFTGLSLDFDVYAGDYRVLPGFHSFVLLWKRC